VSLDTDEVRQLVALADSNKGGARVAEHLWRVLIALSNKTKPDTKLAQEHAALAARRLLELKAD